jgi:DNA repair exonuclease SbcCD ATPase subunit
MGLFSKKPKSIIVKQPATKPASSDEAMDRLEELLPMVEALPHLAPPPPTLEHPPPTLAPVPAPAPKLAAPPKPPKPMKKGKKFSVDPADFIALRMELVDMKARLDESEQARAMVESRLSSLDAAASAFTTERNDISEIADMVLQLQQQIGGAAGNGDAPVDDGRHDELSAKIDAIQNRLFGLTDHSAKISEFEAQIGQLRVDVESAGAAAADAATMAPASPMPSGPDPETLERIAAVQLKINDLEQIRHRLGELDQVKQRMGELDMLHERVAGVEVLHQRMDELDNLDQRLAGVDGLSMQLQQLNARVAAQAELGGQLSALRDRVSQLTDQPQGTADDDIRVQLQEIGERLRANEQLQANVAQLLERAGANDTEARAVREHMALLDQRLTNVSTELANQLSELGRDIDGLGQRVPEPSEDAINGEVVDALRGGQVKLANEQARYEIAFREDLAALAELLRRGRGAN